MEFVTMAPAAETGDVVHLSSTVAVTGSGGSQVALIALSCGLHGMHLAKAAASFCLACVLTSWAANWPRPSLCLLACPGRPRAPWTDEHQTALLCGPEWTSKRAVQTPIPAGNRPYRTSSSS